jgi:hypothetical protein
MDGLNRLFTAHPASVGETYFQHLGRATSFGLRMVGAGLCCLVHGLLPFLFVRTGSSAVTELHDRMVVNRSRLPAKPPAIEAGRDAGALTPG